MRTFTVVPSFEGNSAFFELPDIGFQGDHLSFAILFNLTELTEHWPDILPSMIITNPKGETFIAPNTRWDAEKHIFTWLVSSTETTYEGYVKCQLKCMSADDPDMIVCMSQICQTRVYQSLAAADDPPEAFQSWLDTLAQLGAEISANATTILDSVETTETNARTAQAAANAAEFAKTAAESARNSIEQTARIAMSAQEAATQAQQRAQQAAADVESARDVALETKELIETSFTEMDQYLATARNYSESASDAAVQSATSMSSAITARNEAIAARDSAITAKGAAEVAQNRAETAEEGAQAAQTAAVNAKNDALAAQTAAEAAQSASELISASANASKESAEAAQTAAETAQLRAETARDSAIVARTNVEDYAEASRKWAEGKDASGQNVQSGDATYHNNAKYWAEFAASQAGAIMNFGLYVDAEGNGYIRSID